METCLRVGFLQPWVNAWLGWTLFRNGRSREAITLLQGAIELNPDFPQSHERLGHVYVELRSFDKALERFSGPDELTKRIYVLARSGRGATAQRELEQFLKLPPERRPGAEVGIAATYLALGDRGHLSPGWKKPTTSGILNSCFES